MSFSGFTLPLIYSTFRSARVKLREKVELRALLLRSRSTHDASRAAATACIADCLEDGKDGEEHQVDTCALRSEAEKEIWFGTSSFSAL